MAATAAWIFGENPLPSLSNRSLSAPQVLTAILDRSTDSIARPIALEICSKFALRVDLVVLVPAA